MSTLGGGNQLRISSCKFKVLVVQIIAKAWWCANGSKWAKLGLCALWSVPGSVIGWKVWIKKNVLWVLKGQWVIPVEFWVPLFEWMNAQGLLFFYINFYKGGWGSIHLYVKVNFPACKKKTTKKKQPLYIFFPVALQLEKVRKLFKNKIAL